MLGPRELIIFERVKKNTGLIQDERSKGVLDFIVAACAKEPAVKRAILFGSRARADHDERSDYDVAIDAPGLSHGDWAKFALGLRESIPTLCGLDLVRMDETLSRDLLNKIQSEGLEFYVKK